MTRRKKILSAGEDFILQDNPYHTAYPQITNEIDLSKAELPSSPLKRGTPQSDHVSEEQSPATQPKKQRRKESHGDTEIAKSTKFRRTRVPWTDREILCLRQGVKALGEGKWVDILSSPGLEFHSSRTSMDLKDKWRNLTRYVPYSAHRIRKFILVDEKHNDIRSETGHQHTFRNRWPREAALKVATKDEFYPPDKALGPLVIYLRETKDEVSKTLNPVVYVYKVWRSRELAVNIKKFKGHQFMWTGKAEKLREECLCNDSAFAVVNPTNEIYEEHE